MRVNRLAPLGLAAPAALLAGCASGPAPTPTPSLSHHAPASAAAATSSPPQGPFGVIVTNADRSGSSYQILLLDVNAHVVARATASLPLLQPNETIDLPLISASSSRVYYRNGDTDVDAMQATGATAVARQLTEGASAEIAFSVSADDQRIAILALTEQSDPTKDSGHGYVEDLSGGTNHVDLFTNTSTDAFRWPVGWHGQSVVDAVGQCGGDYYGPQVGAGARGCSYHVIDATSGARRATICESPPNNANGGDYYNPSGNATGAGTSCEETQGDFNTPAGQTQTDMAVDWSGAEHDFLSQTHIMCCALDGAHDLPTDCYLAPDGAQMACLATSNQSVVLLQPGGKTQNLGRRYTILGWIDATHLVVTVDPSTLGVLDTSNGVVSTLSLANADKVSLEATLPGGL
ncbi:MAG: hypothetical protein JO152_11490 [Mycobacteriaceae bacterium]|nr:hypothetical protein [Mycobacteriaceae bacterium]